MAAGDYFEVACPVDSDIDELLLVALDRLEANLDTRAPRSADACRICGAGARGPDAEAIPGQTAMWWQTAAAVLGGLLLVWLALVASLYLVGRKYDDPGQLKGALRLIPDVVRLLRRLPADPTLPPGVRIRLALLLAYLILPVDLVPDFIPVIGYADDAIIVALVLRSVTRSAGANALDRHWPGTPEGLRALRQFAGPISCRSGTDE